MKPRTTRRRNDLLRYWIPWIAFSAAILAVGWLFTDPAPPERVVIATGSRSGAYHAFGEAYAGVFAANAIRLEVRETSGSLENYRLLLDDSGGVDIAIVQGGTAPRGDTPERPPLQAIASLFLEPVWLFARGDASGGLQALRGKRVSVGPEESGTRAVALVLLEAAGLGDAGPCGSRRSRPSGRWRRSRRARSMRRSSSRARRRRSSGTSSGRRASASRASSGAMRSRGSSPT